MAGVWVALVMVTLVLGGWCLGDHGAGDPSAQTMVAGGSGGCVALVTREPGGGDMVTQ